MLVVGPNGAGKTNLLESLHVGTQGFSPRTRADAQLIRFGADAARVAVRGTRGEVPVTTEVVVQRSGGKEARMNGARVDRAERLRSELATLVFTPDRLAVVKGGPPCGAPTSTARSRACCPPRPTCRRRTAKRSGSGTPRFAVWHSACRPGRRSFPWTAQVAELGAELVAARRRVLDLLGPGLAERAGELGLEDVLLDYRAESLSVAALEARLDRDLERGATGLGPHLDEIGIVSGSRDLRSFGSQGEQRLAVLSLLLAEADLIAETRPSPPLLLLDDVLSELDPGRREILAARVGRRGQTVITSTSRQALPVEPGQVIEVSPGKARAA